MTRQLTNKQKSMLDDLIEQYPDAFSYTDLPTIKIAEIALMTINENVYSQMNRYISDKFFERRNKDTSNPFMR